MPEKISAKIMVKTGNIRDSLLKIKNERLKTKDERLKMIYLGLRQYQNGLKT